MKEAAQRLVAGQRLLCELTGEKTRDRDVGVCYLDDCTDIGAAVIAEGLARDCPDTRVGDMRVRGGEKPDVAVPKKICRSKNLRLPSMAVVAFSLT